MTNAAMVAAHAFAAGFTESTPFEDESAAGPGEPGETGMHPHCRHQWNQTPGEADENGGRIYCLVCGDDGDA